MDLIEILRRILQTKNQLKSILGERDNISRYPVAIHNALASRYNAGYRVGYRDRYEELTEEEDGWVTGPEEILPYNLDDTYYEEFTTEILTDIMRDVLNYRIQMKDELNAWLDGDPVTDEFLYYPEWLSSLLDIAYNAGLNGGSECADDDYEGDEDVDMPSAQFSNNKFEMSTSQSEASLWYKIDEDGIETRYTGPIIISDDCTIYYWAKIGRSKAGSSINCTWSSSGLQAFVYPCTFTQSGNYVKIETTTSGAVIEYKLDSSEWRSYYSPVLVNSNSTTLTARAFYQNEYSKKSYYTISHENISSDSRPADVQCTFSASGGVVTVTLTCATPGATIYYNINESAGYYRIYSDPFTQSSNYFLVYVYSELNGVESPHRLVYKYDSSYSSSNTVNPVQFIGDYNGVTLYTTTSGASIWYRFGSSGEYQSANQNQVSFNITSAVQIFAYATKSGMNPSPVTDYYYNPNGGSGYGGGNGVPKPTMTLNGDVVTIYSPLTVRYTVDETDPRSSGGTVQVYNPDTGVKLTTTTTIKAVSVNSSGQFSEVAVGVFTPFSNITDGSSGSEWNPQNPGDNPGGTTDNTDWTNQDWFYVTGASSITFDGGASPLYISENDNNTWQSNYGPQITLNPESKYYMKGSISRILSFGGNAKIGGDIRSLRTSGTTLGTDCMFTGMFRDCTGLVDAVDLKCAIITPLPNQFKEFFSGCTSLVAAPNFLLSTLTNVYSSSCERMFYNCTNLINSPAFNFTIIQDNGCKEMFSGCGKLIDASQSKFLVQIMGASGMASCFKDCSSLVNSPRVEVYSTSNSCLSSCFENCTSLTDAANSIYLSSKTLAVACYDSMFKGSGITSFSALPAPIAVESCYKDMFNSCPNLSSCGSIALTELAENCCNSMFKNCTSLTSSPVLSAERLGGSKNVNCYKEMFMGCSNLSRIEAHFSTEPLEGWWTDNWVTGVASMGTFVQGPDASWFKYGHYAIPYPWEVKKAANVGIIKEIYIDASGLVYITATNSDSIYYTISDTETTNPNDCVLPYEGPFQLGRTSYVCACCENSDGIRGSVTCILLRLVLPGLVISCSDNEVTIYTPYDYTYAQIQYQLYPIGDHSNPETGWTNYSGPFKIEKSQTIAARGTNGNGEWSEIYWADILFGVNAPVIEFTATQYYCTISYPNRDILVALYYKINDTTVDTSTIESTWTLYSAPFTVRDYIDSTHPTVIVTAIAKVTVDGVTGWSSAVSAEKSHSTNLTLPVPFFRMVDEQNSNNAVLVIDGVDYPSWDKTSIKIAYKFNLGGASKYYTQTISTREAGLAFSSYVELYARAESGNVFGEWQLSSLSFNAGLSEFEFDSPTIEVLEADDHYNLHITPPMWIIQDEYGVQHTINTYFRLDVLEATETFTNQYLQWTQWQAAWPYVALDNRIKKAAIYCYSTDDITTKWADPGNEVNPYIFENGFAINIEDCDGPDITFNGRNITMTNKYGIAAIYQYKVENPAWGLNQNDQSLYSDWTTWSGVYRTVDEDLGYGEFYGRFSKDNGVTWSKISGPFNYENSSVVTALVPPTISVTWNESVQLNFIKLTNTVNTTGVWLQYRIVDCVWNGGVVDTHKYDNWKICSLYGESLSEYLMSGTIEARTYIDNAHISDTATQGYTNGWIQPLSAPHIYMIDETTNHKHGFRVVNDNKYAQNYFFIENAVWDGYETNPNKYNNAQICYIYENDLDEHLLSGTIVYYSSWGGETTDQERLDFEFESSIDTTPPTIVVTQNSGSGTYTVTITSNATWMNYPRIKWHMIDVEYSAVPDSSTATYYQSWSGDRFKIEQLLQSRLSFSFEIRENVTSGTIEAYSTDEANTIQTSPPYHATHMTQYFFNINDF